MVEDSPTPLWFKSAIAAGVLLAVVVLVQTIAGYRFISGNLVLQEGQRGAERTVRALRTAVRFSGTIEPTALDVVLEDIRAESPERIAWLAIRNPQGELLASSAGAEGLDAGLEAEEIGRVLSGGNGRIRLDRHGERPVIVGLFPCRCLPPAGFRPGGRRGSPAPGAAAALPGGRGDTGVGANGSERELGRRPPQLVAEVAIFRDSLSAPFGRLRRTALINASAAVALLLALAVIGTRFRDYIRGRQLELQLELARQVQRDLLPPADRRPSGVEFAADCLPAAHVGGDFYDVLELGPNRVSFVLGDVSGHGMSAALLMGLIHGAVSTGTWDGPAEDQERAMERLNHLLLEKTAQEKFATLFWCACDFDRRQLRYINAGHVPPLLVRRSGGSAPQVERLDQGGPVLGLLGSATYRETQTGLGEGDLLVILSDGILEATDHEDEDFGEARVLMAVRDNLNGSAREIRDAVLERVRAFSAGPRRDDQTLLVVNLAARAQVAEDSPVAKTA